MLKQIVLSISLLMIAGCDASDTSEPVNQTNTAERQQAMSDSAFGSMTDTLSRAENVENLSLERKTDIDDAMDTAEGR